MELITLLTILGIFAVLVGLVIMVFLHLASKIDNLQHAVVTDMRDFHGRLCAIEEKYRGK